MFRLISILDMFIVLFSETKLGFFVLIFTDFSLRFSFIKTSSSFIFRFGLYSFTLLFINVLKLSVLIP